LRDEVKEHVHFALFQALASPRIEIKLADAQSVGDGVWRVRIGIANTGWLGTEISAWAHKHNIVLPLTAQIDGIEASNIIDGSNAGSGSGVFSFQVGANSAQTISVTLPNLQTQGAGALSNIASSVVTSATDANSALGSISTALDTVNLARAKMGAVISRLQFTADNLANVSAKAQESRSRIEDTDYSQATTELAKRNIIQQAAQAMLAQANQQPQTVLQLLR
jgi:flagellin